MIDILGKVLTPKHDKKETFAFRYKTHVTCFTPNFFLFLFFAGGSKLDATVLGQNKVTCLP